MLAESQSFALNEHAQDDAASDCVLAFDALELARRELPPIELGRIAVEADGQVRERDSAEPISFSFQYRGLPFAGELRDRASGQLRLVANLGKLPYTIEAPCARRLLRQLVIATHRLARGRFHISEDQDVLFVAEAQAPAPYTPVRVIATVAVLVLAFKPYLELIERASRLAGPARSAQSAGAREGKRKGDRPVA
jgi:hypothetical protein